MAPRHDPPGAVTLLSVLPATEFDAPGQVLDPHLLLTSGSPSQLVREADTDQVLLLVPAAPAPDEQAPSENRWGPRRLTEGTYERQVQQVRHRAGEGLVLAFQPEAARRQSAGRLAEAGAGVVLGADGDGDPTIDFFRRTPVIRPGRFRRGLPPAAGDTTEGPRSWCQMLRCEDGFEVRLRLDSAGEDLAPGATTEPAHTTGTAPLHRLYAAALRASNAPETFLDAVDVGTDELGTFLSLRCGPTGRAGPEAMTRAELPATWSEDAAPFRFDARYRINSQVMRHELQARGVGVDWIASNSLVVAHAGRSMTVHVSTTDCTSQTAASATGDKQATRAILLAAGVAVADGGFFTRRRHLDHALPLLERLGTVVIKPVRGTKGRGVTVDVRTEQEFRTAWESAFAATRGGVLVEQHFRGVEARFLVVGGRCLSVARRTPPEIVGDGLSTIRDLVAAKNRVRRTNPHMIERPLMLDPARVDRLLRHGMTPHTVLAAGETYIVDHKGGFSTGAESVDITEEIHPSYLQAAADAVRAVPGLAVAGVDILVRDFDVKAAPDNYIIVELNSQPGIGAHHFPMKGRAHNIAGAIVDQMLSPRPRLDLDDEAEMPQGRSDEDEGRHGDAARLAEELTARGFAITWLNASYFFARRGHTHTTVWGSSTLLTGKASVMSVRNARITRALLSRAGVPIPQGRTFLRDSRQRGFVNGARAEQYAATLGDITLRSGSGQPVMVSAGRHERFAAVWREVSDAGRGYLAVEQRVSGRRLRVLVAYGQVVSVIRVSAQEGDRDYSARLHHDHRELAIRAAGAFPGLDICEVLLAVRRPGAAAVEGESHVLLVTSSPRLRDFEKVSGAEDRNVVGRIIDLHLHHL